MCVWPCVIPRSRKLRSNHIPALERRSITQRFIDLGGTRSAFLMLIAPGSVHQSNGSMSSRTRQFKPSPSRPKQCPLCCLRISTRKSVPDSCSNEKPQLPIRRPSSAPRVAELVGLVSGERLCVLLGVLWPATRPRRCSQRPPPRLGHVFSAVGSPSLASQSQAPSSRSAPPAPRGCGCSCLAGRLPGPRSARPPPPGTAHPLIYKAPRPGLRHHAARPANRLRPPSPAASCLRPPKSAAPSSRSQRVRARQGILPVKTLAERSRWAKGSPTPPNF